MLIELCCFYYKERKIDLKKYDALRTIYIFSAISYFTVDAITGYKVDTCVRARVCVCVCAHTWVVQIRLNLNLLDYQGGNFGSH